MNALSFDAYYTIHITPEEHCSYASFETNVRQRTYAALIRNVLTLFRPKVGLQQVTVVHMPSVVVSGLITQH